MLHVVVAGASGLVGRELLRQLGALAEVKVTALVRRAGLAEVAANIAERIFDFDDAASYEPLRSAGIPCDVLLIALGSTIRKAGSKAAFVKVDRDYPLRLASAVVAANRNVIIGVVSSVGADRPRGFYLHTKAEMEAGISTLGVRCVFARPSLLLGERNESRPGEHAAAFVLPALFKFGDRLAGRSVLAKYRPITAVEVARALIKHTVGGAHDAGVLVLEGGSGL